MKAQFDSVAAFAGRAGQRGRPLLMEPWLQAKKEWQQVAGHNAAVEERVVQWQWVVVVVALRLQVHAMRCDVL